MTWRTNHNGLCMVYSQGRFMVNNLPTPRVEPEDKSGYCNLYLLCIMCNILQPDWSLLLLVNIKGSLHCKQGSMDRPFLSCVPCTKLMGFTLLHSLMSHPHLSTSHTSSHITSSPLHTSHLLTHHTLTPPHLTPSLRSNKRKLKVASVFFNPDSGTVRLLVRSYSQRSFISSNSTPTHAPTTTNDEEELQESTSYGGGEVVKHTKLWTELKDEEPSDFKKGQNG